MARRHKPTTLDLDGGFHPGPLFVTVKRRMPKRYGTTLQGRLRRAAERQATPPWADRRAIAKVFKRAEELTKLTGTTHSGDHIVPLTHPAVCGLHVAWNLRVMPLAENIRKGNGWWPDMWNEQMELI